MPRRWKYGVSELYRTFFHYREYVLFTTYMNQNMWLGLINNLLCVILLVFFHFVKWFLSERPTFLEESNTSCMAAYTVKIANASRLYGIPCYNSTRQCDAYCLEEGTVCLKTIYMSILYVVRYIVKRLPTLANEINFRTPLPFHEYILILCMHYNNLSVFVLNNWTDKVRSV